ncbi:MAG: MarR family transcriptional regulator [Clostridiales bacterium]|nr:MAG: MarR family transcriptional regulator [Clostridiales bacterium]HJA31172.1 MarR family transcriptional regulator [Candidatus Eisenbergiella pullicola]
MKLDCGAWIIMLAHKVKKRLNETTSDFGITGVQSRILGYILEHCQEGPVFQKDVEDVFGLSRSTATGILQLLEKNGLLTRESVSWDARLKSLVPTERAVQVDESVKKGIQNMEAEMIDGISPGQRQVFLEVVAKISENLDRSSPGRG